ncbi:helix-turn-helix domain-containing protein [Nibribacter koreensis]|uniref:Helix-turn-helix domain-containing protein n=2 Tax=Nibribacter koreensis TaxID=1084519 RepID=A0ABP8FAB8_9BACT
MVFQMEEKQFHCAMDVTMHFIGGKWKTVVLWYLRNDKKRFSELKAQMPQITEKMLSIQLKQLEEDGLVNRVVYASKPPLKVEYSLTDFGKTLLPLLHEIATWGRKTGTEKGKIIQVE